MAAQGIAKRSTIKIGFQNTNFLEDMDKFKRSLDSIKHSSAGVRDAFNNVNQSLDRFSNYMNGFADRNSTTMDRLRDANNRLAESGHRTSRSFSDSADTYKSSAEREMHSMQKINEENAKRSENQHNNDMKEIESLSKVATESRRNADQMSQNYSKLKNRMNDASTASSHVGDRISSANGRIAHSFARANTGIDSHIRSIHEAQSRDYRWLRTAQNMSGVTLGLGAAFYRGAKDAGKLQQEYVHAGNMAHYGGEKMSTVQRNINRQQKVGSQLSIKYATSQDQIASGYQKLVARGYKTNEALHTQESLLQASIASGDSYNDVVKDSTNVLDAYNLRSQNAAKMTESTRKVTNEMAYAADQTATNFRGLGIGMSYVAATAHTTHQSISEASSALGILSNKGMQASQAGVGLRKVLNSFLSVNKKGQQADVMKQLHLSENDFKTSSGHLKSLGSLMSLLNRKTDHMDSQERGSIFHRFFGATGQEAALNLASDTKGLAQLNGQVKKSVNMGGKGYVAILANRNIQKSSAYQVKQFKEAWSAFAISASTQILPTITKITGGIAVLLEKMNKMPSAAKKWTVLGTVAVAALAPVSYAVFGVKSAFHGVETTLLHVRHLFSKRMPTGMTKSASKQALEQETAAETENGTNNSPLNLLNGRDFAKSYKRADTRQFEMDRFPRTTSKLGRLARFGGDYGPESALSIAGKLRKPSMMARLNPFNKSARFFTGRFIPGIKTKPIETGLKATNLFRGSAGSMALRAGGSLLGKVSLITSVASALPMIRSGLKMIDETRIGGKIFGPFNREVIKALNGPIRKINKSFSMIKRGFMAGIRPIGNEWNKIFSGSTKASRSSLRGWERFFNIVGHGISGLFRIVARVFGNILKYAGHMIAGIIKTFRGSFTIIGGILDICTGHFRRGFHLIGHGANITASGIWNTFSNALKGIGSSILTVFGGAWDGVVKKAEYAADTIESFFSRVLGHIENGLNDIRHPIKAAEGKLNSHAAGGAIDHDEMSLVNERGQESAYNPRTNSFRLLGDNGPQVLKLYAGEHVLNAQDTSELIHNGLGKGVTLPGYANGTDRISSLHGVIPGYANGIGDFLTSNNGMGFNKKNYWRFGNLGQSYNTISNIASWDPTGTFSAIAAPRDIYQGIKSGHPIEGTLSGLADLPGAKLLKLGKLGRFGGHAAELAGHISNKANAIKSKLNPISSRMSGLIGKAWKPLHGIGNKLGKHADNAFKMFDFSKWKAPMHRGIRFVGGLAKKAGGKLVSGLDSRIRKPLERWGRRGERTAARFLKPLGHGIAKYSGQIWRGAERGIRKFGRSAIRMGRGIMRKGGRLLRTSGRKLKRFGRTTLSGARRLGSRLWRSTKRIGRRMWKSAKNVGSHIWNGTKHLSRNVGRATRSLWNRTKTGASRTWSRVRTGAGRLIRTTRSHLSSLMSHAIRRAHTTWSDIRSGASHAVTFGEHVLGALARFAEHVKSVIESIPHHLPHFAVGGQIHRNTAALVGENGLETAYNPRTHEVRMLGENGPQITTLLAGERVLTNTQTERLLHGGLGAGVRLPAYAKGTGSSIRPQVAGYNISGSFNGANALKSMKAFGSGSYDIFHKSHLDNITEWKAMSKDLSNINDKMSEKTNDQFKDMTDKVNKLVNDLHDGLVDTTKDMVKKFGSVFDKMADYAKDDMVSVIHKLNKGVRGIDVALRAFGGNSHVISPIHYATGTMNGRIAYNQLGILNDANFGPRQEAILRGNQVLFPHGDNAMVPLQKGDAVLNGNQTQDLIKNTTINHYAKGSGFHIGDKLVKAIGKTMKLALKGPAKFFTNMFGHHVGEPSGHQVSAGLEEMAGNAVRPLGKNWTRAMFNYIKNLLSPEDDNTGGSSSSALLNEMHKLGDGHTYLWGAAGPAHYDCGGLVMAALHALGMPSEHTVYPYPTIPAKDATTGDIVQSATHVGVVADPHAKTYFSAYGPNLAKDSIKTQPLTNEYFTPGHPYYFRRPWKLYHEDQRRMAEKNDTHKKSGNGLERLVKAELGPTATKWLKKASSLIGDGAGVGPGAVDSTRIPGAPGSWTKHGSQAYNIAKAVYTSALSLGLDAKHAAAMVGNAWHESAGFEYGLKVGQFGGGGGKGLFQFTGQGSKYGWSPLGQDKSILANALPGQTASWKKSNGSPYSLAESFETIFERGGIPAYAARAQAADTAYHMFAANGGWADKSHPRIFGESGPEVAINPSRPSADHLIMEAINARIKHNPSSKIASFIRSIGLRQRAHSLVTTVNGLLSRNNSQHPSQQRRPININISFGDINVNSNGGNTGLVAYKVKQAIRRGIQKASYEAIQKMELN